MSLIIQCVFLAAFAVAGAVLIVRSKQRFNRELHRVGQNIHLLSSQVFTIPADSRLRAEKLAQILVDITNYVKERNRKKLLRYVISPDDENWTSIDGLRNAIRWSLSTTYDLLVLKAPDDQGAFFQLRELIQLSRKPRPEFVQNSWIVSWALRSCTLDYPGNWNELVVRYLNEPDFNSFASLPSLESLPTGEMAHRLIRGIERRNLTELMIGLAYCHKYGWTKVGLTDGMYENAMSVFEQLKAEQNAMTAQ